MRREFVLGHSDHDMLGSTNMELDVIDEIAAFAHGPEYIVRKLSGQDKHENLKPFIKSARSSVI